MLQPVFYHNLFIAVNLPYETKVWDEYYDQDTGK